MPGHCITRSVALAAEGAKISQGADHWGDTEQAVVRHLIHTLNVLGLSSDACILDESSVHATLTMGDRQMEVVAILGVSHERCTEHYKRILPTSRYPVMLVSRDSDNNPRDLRFQSYLDLSNIQQDSQRRITDPSGPDYHVSYRDLLDIFLESDTVLRTQEQLNAKLSSLTGRLH